MSDELQQLRDEVARLSAVVNRLSEIEAVKRVRYHYFRCFDTGNVDGLSEVIHPDMTLSVIGGLYAMKIVGREAYLEMIRSGSHADSIIHHNVHHPEIDIVGPEEAIGTWYLWDDVYDYRRNGGIRLYGTAFYRDRYLKHEGRWKLRYAQFHRLFEFSDSRLPVPSRRGRMTTINTRTG
jgi:hypothetical protein